MSRAKAERKEELRDFLFHRSYADETFTHAMKRAASRLGVCERTIWRYWSEFTEGEKECLLSSHGKWSDQLTNGKTFKIRIGCP